MTWSGPKDTERATSLEGPADEQPWGVSEDSPMGEGSEPVAVPEGRRGEQWAAPEDPTQPGAAEEGSAERGEGDLGPVEPTEVPEAGPDNAPEPTPPHRPFPDTDEIRDVVESPTESRRNVPPV